MSDKIIIYQVFTRLFGNDNATNNKNGNKTENGCGTLADFTPATLQEFKENGFTHIWYTGVIEHATQTDYTEYGIARDHSSVVKGKAGSPYAIKDYYDIAPDLAVNVKKRMEEFESLIVRNHKAGLKVVIDFVPNHVARQYHSDAKPKHIVDLGEQDKTNLSFSPQNNFYYIPEEELHVSFETTESNNNRYCEFPAKATGNDQFSSWPGKNDWYETIKLNYGVDYCGGKQHYFDPIPDTWTKMYDILMFWAVKGVDAFRCDMAEMVPAEFWGWVIPKVKKEYPDLVFIAEVYNPNEYRNYIQNGKFDYLYDKVGLYDTLRGIVCGFTPAWCITSCWQAVDDIKNHMLNFLENHDEQRLASDFFAGDAEKGKAALIVSACMGKNPMMIYFGQEFGERGMDVEGFSGCDGRTSIFDYWSVDTIRRWRDKGTFSGKLLTQAEKELQTFYKKIIQLCHSEIAIKEGSFYDLMYANPASDTFNPDRNYIFLRHCHKTLLLIAVNFDSLECQMKINIPTEAFEFLGIKEIKSVIAQELIRNQKEEVGLTSTEKTSITVSAYSGKILKINL